ncbi:hypothetical protein [Mangrovimonas sp. YM274]|uniref:hypothetical protein n=1 Tax=Mangrovimonas sp. YM274 TaxID=3070660 RepID=UPI0027DB0A5B|nr:hypothetical protein [Mangrovimonas sp. YM274]WMI68188.1 hypothetical protein RBH95_13665 [Mangrovimonas sp. YM274]WMI68255.1 hypothetical protein RBH95_14030 [Mangrovimonas sp. YM274]
MKKLLIIILSTTLVSCGVKKNKSEFDKMTFDKELNSNLFNSTESILNPLTLKIESGYDNLPDSTQYSIKSNAIVNNDSLRLMRFAELKRIDSDTLELQIFETNPAYSQNLTIKIIDNQFKSDFKYWMSGPPIDPKIKKIKQELIVKSIPKQKGEMIFGKFYFKGICESDCSGEIEIKGDFKAMLE